MRANLLCCLLLGGTGLMSRIQVSIDSLRFSCQSHRSTSHFQSYTLISALLIELGKLKSTFVLLFLDVNAGKWTSNKWQRVLFGGVWKLSRLARGFEWERSDLPPRGPPRIPGNRQKNTSRVSAKRTQKDCDQFWAQMAISQNRHKSVRTGVLYLVPAPGWVYVGTISIVLLYVCHRYW